MPKTIKPKGKVINGVRFRPGECAWEDAYGEMRSSLPNFETMRAGTDFIGSKITAVGLIAKIGKYLVVITEHNDLADEYDYTLIPLAARTIVKYH